MDMNGSAKLTRLLLLDWLKQNWVAMLLVPFVVFVIAVYGLNPATSGMSETALLIRVQSVPSQYENKMMAFVELPTGRTVAVQIPQGIIAPVPGSSIRVMHNQHLLLGDSFQWIQ